MYLPVHIDITWKERWTWNAIKLCNHSKLLKTQTINFSHELMKYVIKALHNQQNLKFNLLQFLSLRLPRFTSLIHKGKLSAYSIVYSADCQCVKTSCFLLYLYYVYTVLVTQLHHLLRSEDNMAGGQRQFRCINFSTNGTSLGFFFVRCQAFL